MLIVQYKAWLNSTAIYHNQLRHWLELALNGTETSSEIMVFISNRIRKNQSHRASPYQSSCMLGRREKRWCHHYGCILNLLKLTSLVLWWGWAFGWQWNSMLKILLLLNATRGGHLGEQGGGRPPTFNVWKFPLFFGLIFQLCIR